MTRRVKNLLGKKFNHWEVLNFSYICKHGMQNGFVNAIYAEWFMMLDQIICKMVHQQNVDHVRQ